MPPTRTGRRQWASNEDDENTKSTRMTRAKAHAAERLQTRKGVIDKPSTTAMIPKKTTRNALRDISNARNTAAKRAVSKVGAVNYTATDLQQSACAPPTQSALGGMSAYTNGNGESGRSTLSKKKAQQAAPSELNQKPELEGKSSRKQARVAAAGPVHAKRAALAKDSKAAEPEPKHTKESIVNPRLLAGEVPPGVVDLSMDDYENPLMVAEYADEIFSYLLAHEASSMPNPNYMNHQDDIEWKTRGILVDWLIEVHTRFRLVPETLFLAVNIVDRFLSEKVVKLDRLQLVGITAMFIASKYEEVKSYHISEFSRVTDDSIRESEILKAERFILSTLNFDLS
ncbi:hypothetical protein MCOR05_006100 [Pyricularia oryzae]|nr:hypothetical protein MCOR05_006100 [Pyricularia oryzae]